MEQDKMGDSTRGDRRGAPRYLGCVPVRVDDLWGGVDYAGVTHDVSATGGRLFTQGTLGMGDLVRLKLFLSEGAKQPTVVYARVVRSTAHQAPRSIWPCDAAVRFDVPITLGALEGFKPESGEAG